MNVYEGYAALLMPRSSLDPSTLTLLTARRSQDEPLDFIRSARVTWEEGINEELYAIVSEARRPFCIVRCVVALHCIVVLCCVAHNTKAYKLLCNLNCSSLINYGVFSMYVCMYYVCMYVCIIHSGIAYTTQECMYCMYCTYVYSVLKTFCL